MEWNKTYPFATAYNVLRACVATTSDGGYALTFGNSLVKTDPQGNMQWIQTFEGTQRRSINSMVVTSDGGYVLAGFYGDYDKPKSADIWVIKTNKYGHIPEFSSYIILPIVMTATIIGVAYRKKLFFDKSS
jgi:hypothetical protein